MIHALVFIAVTCNPFWVTEIEDKEPLTLNSPMLYKPDVTLVLAFGSRLGSIASIHHLSVNQAVLI